jgi:hypothetical protein
MFYAVSLKRTIARSLDIYCHIITLVFVVKFKTIIPSETENFPFGLEPVLHRCFERLTATLFGKKKKRE